MTREIASLIMRGFCCFGGQINPIDTSIAMAKKYFIIVADCAINGNGT
jgi:hypothetical protein